MYLKSIVDSLSNSNLFLELDTRTKKERITINCTSRLANSLLISGLSRTRKSPLVIITPTFEEAGRYLPLLELFGWNKTFVYPSSDYSPYDKYEQSSEITWGQLQVISELIEQEDYSNLCIITTERCLQPHLPPLSYIRNKFLYINKLDSYNLEDLAKSLSELGYEKDNLVQQEAKWSRRGDIIDIFPVNRDAPIRLEFFGDKLEKIKELDPITQRSHESIDRIVISPVSINSLIEDKLNKDLNININESESLKNYLSIAWPNKQSLLDYLPSNSFVVIEDESQCISHCKIWYEKIQEELCEEDKSKFGELTNKPTEIMSNINKYNGINISSLNNIKNNNLSLDISNRPLNILPNQFGKLGSSIKEYIKNRDNVFLISAQPSRAVALLQEHECPSIFLNQPNKDEVLRITRERNVPIAFKCNTDAQLAGVYLPSFKIVLITDKEFFGQQSLVNNSYIRRRRKSISKSVDPNKLHPGDYVVHKNHGVGLFKKMEKISISGETRDYLVLKYIDGILRVAADQLSSIGRYRVSGDKEPKLNKLGGNTWSLLKQKTKRTIKKVAVDLVKLYAERSKKKGFSFPKDGPWQNELEDSFPYEPTKDQLLAVKDVKHDMEKEIPMDRLICGDVGYGKTEVAIRAIFKAITGGKQIAMLAPTTILAQQHWRTLSDRFAPYPIKVSLLNRFKTNIEKREILNGLENGTIDAVIGTHQLLNKKTIFSNLGLLVIDEEQRFGVNQKEKIKSLKKSVDVLTLSATPIPRTLYMSLSGVREMSLINTPPPLRRSIKTNLSKMDDDVIRSAISQEIDRGGQIFYVVPRVSGIEEIANKIKTMIPKIRLIIAHGQMSEGELESSMIAFNAGEADLMLCTTIVESGLDIPRVNTIIIEDSQKFGLSQLYQLRGRVGRSGVQAYAWLFYPDNIKLSDSALQRLKAIQEFSSLGSGYQLSMRDMEIRGVGNLIGVEQSGQMEAIGFDLYMEMLQEALAEIDGQKIPKVEEAQIDLKITAFIPGDYIIDSDQKISAYKSASECKTNKDLIELATSWIDIYGPLPKSVETLLSIMKLKLLSKECGFSRIKTDNQNIILETLMDESGFRLLRQGLPKHLHGRLIYKKKDKVSEVLARGLGNLQSDKQIEELSNWLTKMKSQIKSDEFVLD